MLFENFLYQSLRSIRTDPALANREVVLLMDNAVIHKHSSVLETARRMKVNVLFNAEYSPWLNPIEQLFGLIKKQLRNEEVNTK
jgi:transposase